MWLISGPISVREGRRWSTQKEEVPLAVCGSGEGATIGRLQSLLGALAVVSSATIKGFGLRESHNGSFTSLCVTPRQRSMTTGFI